jgi:hypothetical protein
MNLNLNLINQYYIPFFFIETDAYILIFDLLIVKNYKKIKELKKLNCLKSSKYKILKLNILYFKIIIKLNKIIMSIKYIYRKNY